ncbi:MAG: GAF domain-containing protein, partial [Nitrospinota bacterium]
LQRKRPLYTPDARIDPYPRRRGLAALGLRSLLNVPILSEGECIGFLNVGSEEVDAFTKGHVELLRSVADHLAIAMKNARAFGEVRRKSAQIARLNEINRELSSALDLDEVLENIVQTSRELIGGIHIGLYLLDDEGRTLVPHPQSFSEWDPIGRQSYTIKVGENLSGWVAEHREVLAVAEARRDPRWVEMPWAGGKAIGGYAGIPLLAGEELVGVMSCFTQGPHRWTQDELELLKSFAAQAAVAIQNARLHQALASSEERYRSLAETATDAVVTVDGEGRITLFNAAAERMFGYSAAEALGMPLLKLVPEPDGERYRADLRRFLETRESEVIGRTFETKGLRKDGSAFALEVSISVAETRGRVRITSICRDITERKRTEEELRRAQAQLIRSEKLASLGTLVAGVAHEILNPMNTLYIQVQMLQESVGTEGPKKLRESFASMRREIERASRITRNLLDFARRHKPQLKPLDVRKVLDQVVDLVGYQYRVSNVELLRDYVQNLPLVEGDEDQLSQVFLNLISNARSVLPEGGRITLRVQSFLCNRKSWVRVAVEDTGAGIPKEIRHRIFDPFFTTKPEGKGTGLGLSVSYGIVENHGGRLDVRSEEGKGTTF